MNILKIDWSIPTVLAAIVTASAALIVALFNFFSGRISQREIEMLKSKMADLNAEKNARRAYEFEARKRLYEEYEPLLFQLMEAAENVLFRIQNIANAAKEGNLGEKGWFSRFNYYTKSTIYKIFAPMAIYRIMQKKLTQVDVSLDESIGLRYLLAKQVYLSFTDDYKIAGLYKKLEYDPNSVTWKELRIENPSQYWRQGLPMGLLDKTIDVLIEKDENSNKERIISYGEFERKLVLLEKDEKTDISFARDLFLDFYPEKRPVLWRILIIQAVLLNALLKLREVPSENILKGRIKEYLQFSEHDISRFQWGESDEMKEFVNEPFHVAAIYFEKQFS